MANLNLRTPEWGHPLRGNHPLGEVSYFGYEQAQERGRKMAAEALRLNPSKREELEQTFGLAYCKARYPEAYSRGKVWEFLRGLKGRA